MQDSSNRPAWTQTLFQGRGGGMDAFKHRIMPGKDDRDKPSMVLKENYDYTASANEVPANKN